ncbi:MAG TPA: HAMP domain-containing sensor histidine kinase [Planctomicrobium sp.]|nr:HAMP domain-containing sensor histidine kinase [Planctomicrobium sp.]
MNSVHQKPVQTRWRRFRRTLRFRLAAMNAMVVVLISLTALAIVRQGVEWALYRELDQLLTEDLQEVSLSVRGHHAHDFELIQDELSRKSLGRSQHGWFVELRDSQGSTIWASEGAPVITDRGGAALPSAPFTQDDFRIVHRQVRPESHRIHSVYVGSKLELLHLDMKRIDRLVLAASIVLIVTAPLCGYWLAGRATRSIAEIIQTASRLRPTRLDERLPLRGVDDELDLLAQTINGLLDRIANYLLQRREFLANAAHELRTPLAAIRSCIEVALDGRKMSEEEQALLENLIHQSNFLEVLVNQLLVISENETGQWAFDPEQVPLHEVVQRAIDMFQGVSEANGIALQFKEKQVAHVSGSRRYLRQVVNNLIDNAVKYTRPGGRISVSLTVDTAQSTVLLTVADTGVGIAEKDVARVFERFFRADRGRGRETSIQGTGLGLSICEAVVTAHGGTIECQSQLHEGTTIIIHLPLLSEQTDAATSGGNIRIVDSKPL